MGCGDSKHGNASTSQTNMSKKSKENKVSPQDYHSTKQTAESKRTTKASSSPEEAKNVAFEIEFESNHTNSVLMRNPPKRLQRLEPLHDAPKLSAEQLEEKLRLAEEKRSEQLERKKTASKKSSRLRQQILEARELDKEEEQRQEINDKLLAAEKAKEQKLKVVKEKQKMREERAQRTREKAKRLKTDEGCEIEFEKDEGYNNDDVDSWLDGDNNTSDYHTDHGERLTSGNSFFNGERDTRGSQRPQGNKQNTFNDYSSNAFEPNLSTRIENTRYDRTTNDDFFD